MNLFQNLISSPLRGRIEVGVKSQLWLIFYPHPNLPPARGRSYLLMQMSSDCEIQLEADL